MCVPIEQQVMAGALMEVRGYVNEALLPSRGEVFQAEAFHHRFPMGDI